MQLERPTEICESCFEKNRLTHNAGDGSELIGTYCTHSKTGAQAERRGEEVSKWFTNPGVGERPFWHLLRLSARMQRGELTPAQVKVEILTFARKNERTKK